MIRLLVPIALQLVFTSSVLSSTNTISLGQGFFVATKNLFGSDFDSGATIFESLPTSCLQVIPKPETKQTSTFFQTSAKFYEYTSATVGLSASVKGSYTMKTTLTLTSESISGSSLETSGMSLDIYALKDATVLSQDCLNSQPLSTTFLADFNKLPVQIKDPNSQDNWSQYDSFLKKYGSHLVKEINHGARLQQWVFASQSKTYSERDFNVRACVDLSRDTGNLKMDLCGNYTTSEKNEVLKLTMSNQLQLKGGTAETRAKLRNERTAELIETFMIEANNSPGNVLYKWTAIWDLLKQRFIGVSGDNFARIVNLETYYKGVLDFGCTHVSKNGVVLRWLQQNGTPQQPEFFCQIAREGCRHGESDCHLEGAGSACYCYGPTCVDTKSVNNPNSKIKEERVMRTSQTGSYKDGINNSCYYHFIAHCDCHSNWGGKSTNIWPSDSEIESRRLLWAVHTKTKKHGNKGKAYYIHKVLRWLAQYF